MNERQPVGFEDVPDACFADEGDEVKKKDVGREVNAEPGLREQNTGTDYW